MKPPGQEFNDTGFPTTYGNLSDRRSDDPMREYLKAKFESAEKHMDQRFASMEKLIRSGFPNDDPATHRAVHEGFIDDAAERIRLRRALTTTMMTGGIWACVGLIGVAVWEYIKSEIKK